MRLCITSGIQGRIKPPIIRVKKCKFATLTGIIVVPMSKYNEYRQLNLPQIGESVQKYWEENHCFEQSLKNREGYPDFVFYEGPPSANGVPGIHHVMARTIKDIFCRYKTLKGFNVQRKAGWDTHGLPVELGVEKSLGITKEDIGKKISVEDYNAACRKEVMKYKDLWDNLTRKMGYWVIWITRTSLLPTNTSKASGICSNSSTKRICSTKVIRYSRFRRRRARGSARTNSTSPVATAM